ncbi:hypothetical protein C5F51_33155 [Nocardia nova]|uniref:Uncharacterized protein n=1 Tax=Nocardia nova TaxID=37330 RepID=A0A2S5ZW18_9NOCA|nr:hypothetical protein C5F51_33155 [Nocardia nova]
MDQGSKVRVDRDRNPLRAGRTPRGSRFRAGRDRAPEPVRTDLLSRAPVGPARRDVDKVRSVPAGRTPRARVHRGPDGRDRRVQVRRAQASRVPARRGQVHKARERPASSVPVGRGSWERRRHSAHRA